MPTPPLADNPIPDPIVTLVVLATKAVLTDAELVALILVVWTLLK